MVALIDQPHIVGVVGERVAQDQVDIGLVPEDDLVEEADGELRELDRVLAGLDDFLVLLAVHALAHPAGNGPDGMDRSAGHHLDELVASAAHLDDLAADLDADLVDDAQDVALGGRGVGAHDKVGPSEGVEMGRVIGHVKNDIQQLPQDFGRVGQVDMIDGVTGLGRGHHVRLRTDTADPGRDAAHLLDGTADAELLETAELGDLEAGVRDIPVVVQENGDLSVAFEPGDGIDGDRFHLTRLPMSEPARPNR